MGGSFSMFTLIAGITISFMAGFWIGRILNWREEEGAEDTDSEATPGWQSADRGKTEKPEVDRERTGRERGRTVSRERLLNSQMAMEAADLEAPRIGYRQKVRERRKKGVERAIPTGKAIGSPCSGEVNFFYEGNRRGAVIAPAQGFLYAPASGKITKLYPMGNAFLLRTDFGVELLIKVGDKRDELLSMYYRPRIVQNEIVNKGKLLLEFDPEGLKSQGADVSVSVTVEAADDYRDVLVTEQERVRVGETVIWVRDRKFPD